MWSYIADDGLLHSNLTFDENHSHQLYFLLWLMVSSHILKLYYDIFPLDNVQPLTVCRLV